MPPRAISVLPLAPPWPPQCAAMVSWYRRPPARRPSPLLKRICPLDLLLAMNAVPGLSWIVASENSVPHDALPQLCPGVSASS